ncbi:MAG: TetR family transcriptional regulator [Myxococcales bacterium]|nr:TetR family transcriptional regulator [Myxococcales bacterium]
MSRPSLAPQRREQILDAFEACVGELGLAGSSLAQVARRSGMATSHVSHYFGSRAGLVDALVTRLEERYAAAFDAAVGRDLGSVPLEEQLDFLLSDAFNDPASGVVFREIVAHSARDEHAREALARVYRRFDDTLRRSLAVHLPHLDAEAAATFAHAAICLAEHTALLVRLGRPEAAARGRAAARRLLACISSEDAP